MFLRWMEKKKSSPINLAKARLVAAEKTLEKLKTRPRDIRIHDIPATPQEINHLIQVWTRNVSDFKAHLAWLEGEKSEKPVSSSPPLASRKAGA